MSDDAKTPEVTEPPKKRGGAANFVHGRSKGRGRVPSLTPSQKAEAAALWRTGEITLDGLSKKFKKRPETFSRLFKEMGISKGEAALEHQKKVAQAVETQLLRDSETVAHRIATTKDKYFNWLNGLSMRTVHIINEQARTGGRLEAIQGDLRALNLAASTLSKVREEIYVLLQVEKHDNAVDDDELPELTVRELTPQEVTDLQGASVAGDLDIDDDIELDDPEPVEIPGRAQKPSTGGG